MLYGHVFPKTYCLKKKKFPSHYLHSSPSLISDHKNDVSVISLKSTHCRPQSYTLIVKNVYFHVLIVSDTNVNGTCQVLFNLGKNFNFENKWPRFDSNCYSLTSSFSINRHLFLLPRFIKICYYTTINNKEFFKAKLFETSNIFKYI